MRMRALPESRNFAILFFANLTYTLTGKTQLVADLFKSLLVTTNAEALTDDGYLALFQHFLKYGV